MDTTNTAFIYYGKGGHPSHEGFQEAIDADALCIPKRDLPLSGLLKWPVESLSFSPKQYDYYVIEQANTLFVAPLVKRMYPDSKVILLLADPTLFKPNEYDNKYRPNHKKAMFVNTHWFLTSTITSRIASRYIDGIISVSGFALKKFDKYIGNKPHTLAYPFIQENKLRLLDQIEPNLGANRAVMIGGERTYKGIGPLLDAWPLVRNQIPDATLHVIGKTHPEKRESIPGITTCGYVSDKRLVQELSEASLYLHPAILETFGVSVIEALRGGVPAIVTRTTGSQCVIKQLDENLIVSPDPDDIASNVITYFSSPMNYKIRISDKSKELVANFDENSKKQEFRNSFKELTGIV